MKGLEGSACHDQHPKPNPDPRLPAPRPRGGRRPGAGAPVGNINALSSGGYSRRYAGHVFFLRVLLTIAPQALPLPSASAVRRRRVLQLLEALRTVVRISPELPQQLEDHARDYMKSGSCYLPDGPMVRMALRESLSGSAQLHRALTLVVYIHDSNPDFAPPLTRTPFLAPILEYLSALPGEDLGSAQQPGPEKKRKIQ